MNRRNFLKMIGSFTALNALSSCDILTNPWNEFKPKPSFNFKKKYSNFDWQTYLENIESYYKSIRNKNKKELKRLNMEEINQKITKITKPYLDYMQHLSQIAFDYEKLIILNPIINNYPKNHIKSLIKGYNNDASAGGYINNYIFIYINFIDLKLITHEFGHHTDKKLNYIDWAFSNFAKSRSEAVAESFVIYVSHKLKKIHPKTSENLINDTYLNHRTINKKFSDLKKGSPYSNANLIMAIYNKQFQWDYKKTWKYLSETSGRKMYSELEKKCKNLDFSKLVHENYYKIKSIIEPNQ